MNIKPQMEELKLLHKKNYLLLKIAFSEGFDNALRENNTQDMNDYKRMLEELEISFEMTKEV